MPRSDDDEDRPRRRPVRRDEDEEERIAPEPRRAERRPERVRPRRRDEDDEDDYDEDEDDRPRRRRLDRGGSTLIPTKNKAALTAYYCGVFALIPGLGCLLAPMAVIFGIIGLLNVQKNPRAKGTGHAIAGLVLGVIGAPIVWGIVWFIVTVLLAVQK